MSLVIAAADDDAIERIYGRKATAKEIVLHGRAVVPAVGESRVRCAQGRRAENASSTAGNCLLNGYSVPLNSAKDKAQIARRL
jgi:hypothetical protein